MFKLRLVIHLSETPGPTTGFTLQKVLPLFQEAASVVLMLRLVGQSRHVQRHVLEDGTRRHIDRLPIRAAEGALRSCSSLQEPVAIVRSPSALA